jgi:sialidase-1
LTFNKLNLLNTLVQPLTGCEGSTIYYPNTHQLFYTGLADTSYTRKNLSLYISEDNGENWRFIKTIFQGPSAYSSLIILRDQSIGLLYEWANQTDVVFQSDYISFIIVYNQTKKEFF